ncbi:hypothetical protein BKA64DRAFT_195510 [Cadophora sp. MPI-SDFR-AT-0126]|nr:hypothetical protein BKA64DRAFT_195510 [Leotiomycetes sp. MPI-SDFR-AT-0126]
MKLKTFLIVLLLGLQSQHVVAQMLSYGYSAGYGCTDIVTITMDVPDTSLPSEGTSSAIGTAANSSTSDSIVETTISEFVTMTTSFTALTTCFQTTTDTSTRSANTSEITTTIKGPEESSTESPATSGVVETPATDFPHVTTTTSSIEVSSNGDESKSRPPAASHPQVLPEALPNQYLSLKLLLGPMTYRLSPFSFPSTDTITPTAGGVVATPTARVGDFPTSWSTETTLQEVTYAESLTETFSSVISTSTGMLLNMTTTNKSSTFTTTSTSPRNCTPTQANGGQFTATSLGAAISTEVPSSCDLTSSSAGSSSVTNISSISTAPLTTVIHACRFSTTALRKVRKGHYHAQ